MSALFSKTATSNSTAGLRKKPTYEELINYIREDPDTIRYPNRDATIMANSFEFNQRVGEGFRQLAQMSNNAQDAARTDSLLRTFASASKMDLGKLKALLDDHGLKPVEVPVGSDFTVLKELPDMLSRLGISTNSMGNETNTSSVESPSKEEMNEDYSEGPINTPEG